MKTDAQGIPFRCIILIVICNIGFFGTATLLAGFNASDDSSGGYLTIVFLVVMVLLLVTYILILSRNDRARLRKDRGEEIFREPLISLASESKD